MTRVSGHLERDQSNRSKSEKQFTCGIHQNINARADRDFIQYRYISIDRMSPSTVVAKR